MGSFDVTCFVTRKTIHPGDEIVLFPMNVDSNYSLTNMIMNSTHNPCYISHPPIFGEYDDYGNFQLSGEQFSYWDNIVLNDVMVSVEYRRYKLSDTYGWCLREVWEQFSKTSYDSWYLRLDCNTVLEGNFRNAHIPLGKQLVKDLNTDISKIPDLIRKVFQSHWVVSFSNVSDRLLGGEFNELLGQLYLFNLFTQLANVSIMPAKSGSQNGEALYENILGKMSASLAFEDMEKQYE